MIYKIKSDYYIYRDRKYIKIKADLNNGEVLLVPDMNTFIEDNNNVDAKQMTIDDVKKDLQEKNNNKEIRSRYTRDR